MKSETPSPGGIVVVGGGVVGLAVAYELLRRGQRVLVLERHRPGCGASHVAGGMLSPVSEVDPEDDALLEFGQDSLRRYPDFVAALERVTGESCPYRKEGTLWIGTNRDDRDELNRLLESLRGRGLRARAVDAADIREREPNLSTRVLGGVLLEDDHQIDPRALIRCLEQAVESLGGRIICGARVTELHAERDRLQAVAGIADDGKPFAFACDHAVLSSGAWTDQDIVTPLGELSIRPIKGQLLHLRGPAMLRHGIRTPDVYLVPREDGSLLVGTTMEEMGFDTTPTAGAVMDLLRHAWDVLPGIYDLEVREISVGLRSASADQLPLIGQSSLPGLHLALGHFRSGVLLAPATAHYLARAIVEGRPADELEPFSPGRFARNAELRGTE